MSKVNIFLDSSALFAGIASPMGAARVLLQLAETGKIDLTISHQVVVETERAVAKKIPRAISDLRQALLMSKLQIVADPSLEEVARLADWMKHRADVPILIAAMQARADFLVTLNRKHFLEDETLGERAGLRIGTPGDGLAWVRSQISLE